MKNITTQPTVDEIHELYDHLKKAVAAHQKSVNFHEKELRRVLDLPEVIIPTLIPASQHNVKVAEERLARAETRLRVFKQMLGLASEAQS